MTEPIEDVSSLPGRKVSDHEETPIGEVKKIYAMDDGFPMWVAVESRTGIGETRTSLIPLARLKDEGDDLRVPYSKSHILEAPQIDADDELSAECDQELRRYYGIGAGDQELWSDNKSFATLVPEEEGSSEPVEDAEKLETPDADKRTDETSERLKDPGPSEARKTSADEMAEGDRGGDGDAGDGQDDRGDEDTGDDQGDHDR
jgi:hypothetical protein